MCEKFYMAKYFHVKFRITYLEIERLNILRDKTSIHFIRVK